MFLQRSYLSRLASSHNFQRIKNTPQNIRQNQIEPFSIDQTRSCFKVSAMSNPGQQYPLEELVSSTFFLDPFAIRQWEKSDTGIPIQFDQKEFVAKVQASHDGGQPLVEGYAPFCKHVFVPNFCGMKTGVLPITEDNLKLLKSGYVKRRPEELAVLSRWFSKEDFGEMPEAKYLDIILYSREQIEEEYAAIPTKGEAIPDRPWGIISIKPQLEDYETPMQPITMLRNALGKEEGGSGVALDKDKYQASVDFWEKHAIVL